MENLLGMTEIQVQCFILRKSVQESPAQQVQWERYIQESPSHMEALDMRCSPWDQSFKASLYQLYDIDLRSTSSLPQNCYFRAKFTMHEIAQVMYSAFGTWCPEKIATLAGSSPWIGRYTLFTAGAQEKYPHMYMHIPTLTGQLSAILQTSTISTKYKILWLFVSLKG